jgi:hypothetical protein
MVKFPYAHCERIEGKWRYSTTHSYRPANCVAIAANMQFRTGDNGWCSSLRILYGPFLPKSMKGRLSRL